jgi:hypothetical protein
MQILRVVEQVVAYQIANLRNDPGLAGFNEEIVPQ